MDRKKLHATFDNMMALPLEALREKVTDLLKVNIELADKHIVCEYNTLEPEQATITENMAELSKLLLNLSFHDDIRPDIKQEVRTVNRLRFFQTKRIELAAKRMFAAMEHFRVCEDIYEDMYQATIKLKAYQDMCRERDIAARRLRGTVSDLIQSDIPMATLAILEIKPSNIQRIPLADIA